TTRQFVIVHHGVAVPTLLAFTALNGAFPPTVELHLWPPSLIGAYGPTQALGGTRVSVGAQLSGPAPFSVIIIGLESSDQAILPIREHGPVPADSYVYRTEARAALVGAPVDVTITATGQDW